MGGFDRERLRQLATELEAALEARDDRAAQTLLTQLRPLFQRIAAGQVDGPVKVPGHRIYIESSLPDDPKLDALWSAFGNVAEGVDTERFLALFEARRKARGD